MGIGGMSIWELLIILVIVLVLFGAKRLRNVGTDLGEAIKGFRKSVKDGESEPEVPQSKLDQTAGDTIIEGMPVTKEKKEA